MYSCWLAEKCSHFVTLLGLFNKNQNICRWLTKVSVAKCQNRSQKSHCYIVKAFFRSGIAGHNGQPKMAHDLWLIMIVNNWLMICQWMIECRWWLIMIWIIKLFVVTNTDQIPSFCKSPGWKWVILQYFLRYL
jgi:hypothetical protein